ncbi:MAG: hypothetical protein JXB32_02570 [Deltaproteobacteria bacterium]|nr:hypothetical protein [Deltaproteobacteria bacterium]
MKESKRNGTTGQGTRRGTVRAFAAAATVGAAATLAVLGAGGPATATAGDKTPLLDPAAPIAARFVPALADGTVVEVEPATIEGATLRTRLQKKDDGTAAILVEVSGPPSGSADVQCRVALDLLEYGDVPPYARIMPEPTVRRVFSMDVDETVAAGTTRRFAWSVPADVVARFVEGTNGRLALEATGAR